MAKSLFAQAAGEPQKEPASADHDDVQAAPQAKITVRAELRLRNADMIDARKRLGFSQITLAALANVSLAGIGALEKFDFSNLNAVDHARRVAAVLEIPLESILPPELRGQKLASTIVGTAQIDTARLLDMQASFERRFLLPSPAETVLDKDAMTDEIMKVLGSLTYREREVIKLRYGLTDDGCSYTMSEVGKKFFMSAERVRQIEAKALRKLQYPARAAKLEQFLPDGQPLARSHADAERVRLSRLQPPSQQQQVAARKSASLAENQKKQAVITDKYHRLRRLARTFRYGYYTPAKSIISNEQYDQLCALVVAFEKHLQLNYFQLINTKGAAVKYPREVLQMWRKHAATGVLNHWADDIDGLIAEERLFLGLLTVLPADEEKEQS